MDLLGREYYYDNYGPTRLHAALAVCMSAWEIAKGDVNLLYQTIGKRGNCAICGAGLTDELSMVRGIGPECFRHIGVKMAAVKELQKRNLSKAKKATVKAR